MNMNRPIEDRIKFLEDKVDHLSESLEFVCKQVITKPPKKFSMGDRVYKTFVWPYYEQGVIRESSFGETHELVSRKTWSYLVEWEYNSKFPIPSHPKSKSWWSEDMIFGSLDEYKTYLKTVIDQLVRPQYE